MFTRPVLWLAVGLPLLVGALAAGLHRPSALSVALSGASASSDAGGALSDAAAQSAGLTIQFSDKPVPLPAVSVTDLSGKPLSSADWRGKVVLVNFWATWCGPCRAEIPEFVKMQDRYRDHLVIVGLSVDEGSPDGVREFTRTLGVNYPVAIVDEQVQQAFGGIVGLPTTFVVNPRGQIVQRHMGFIDAAIYEQEVRALAGLQTDAKIETVKDTGQVLLANAAYATEIPGLDLTQLTAAQREEALRRLNTEKCTCGCGLTLAACRINDAACGVSLPLAAQVVKAISGQP